MPRYTNLDPSHRRPGTWDVWRWLVLDRILGRRRIAPAGPPASRVSPDLQTVQAAGRLPRITWIGHASFLLSLEGRHLLFDPVFSGRVGLTYRRHVEPGLSIAELPPIDGLLISHSHYDHLDAASVTGLGRDLQVLVPAGLGQWFRRRRFRNVRELSWWQETSLGSLEVTFVPARHWTQRTPWDYNRSLWGGFVVAGREFSVYFAGDSAWFDGFGMVAERFPALDLALLPIGGYAPGWFMERNHMTPEQAVQACVQLNARAMLPMHWGTFQLTDEPLREPVERLRAAWDREPAVRGRQLLLPAIGETVPLERGGSG